MGEHDEPKWGEGKNRISEYKQEMNVGFEDFNVINV